MTKPLKYYRTLMNQQSLPIVALVGLPNAGKSTLINKIGGKQFAITSDLAGTTRDRQYLDVAWNGADLTLADTAGISLNAKNELDQNIQKQVEVALNEAAVIVLLVDGKDQENILDAKILKKIRSSKKPLILAVNKLDSPKNLETGLIPFYSLGIKNILGISALTGRGTGDLLDEITRILPKSPASVSITDDETQTKASNNSIAISIVGKPNVGKSSLFNALLKEERVVVSSVPGTTRTSIDSQVAIDNIEYTFIDTAGLKKKEYRQTRPDLYGGFQTFKAIRRSDVCFFVIDVAQEITKQDQVIAGEIVNMQKGCIILANKADLLSPSATKKKTKKSNEDEYRSLRDQISHHFPFLWMCPMFFVSAVTGEGLSEAVAAIKPIFDSRNKNLGDEILKELLAKKMKINPPKLLRDQKKPKVFSLRQTEINPPKFELLVNHPAAISMQFRKFVENSIIKELGFWGTPIVLKTVGKDKT